MSITPPNERLRSIGMSRVTCPISRCLIRRIDANSDIALRDDRCRPIQRLASVPVSSAPAPIPRVIPEENEFTSERHVYEPHKIGIPPLRPYVRELWRRRE